MCFLDLTATHASEGAIYFDDVSILGLILITFNINPNILSRFGLKNRSNKNDVANKSIISQKMLKD